MQIGSIWDDAGARSEIFVKLTPDSRHALVIERADRRPDRVIAVMTSLDAAESEAVFEVLRRGGLPGAPEPVAEGPPPSDIARRGIVLRRVCRPRPTP